LSESLNKLVCGIIRIPLPAAIIKFWFYSPNLWTNFYYWQLRFGLGIITVPQVPAAQFYPNPFVSSFNVSLPDVDSFPVVLQLYNVLGAKMLNTTLTQYITNVQVDLPAGVYYYRLLGKDGMEQTGKLISKQ